MIYWPAVRTARAITPELSRIGLNETLVNGQTEAIELLVNERAGLAPQGYLFLNFGGELVPALRFNGLPVAQACARCHADRQGAAHGAFQPFFLRTVEGMLKVGYRGEKIIKALLRR